MKTLPLIAALALVLGGGNALAQDGHGHGDHDAHAAHSAPADHAAHQAHAAHGADQHDPEHHAAHHGAMEIPADHVRWEPDAPLMAGMRRVGTAVDTLRHHEMGHLADEQVLTLAGEVDEAIAYMFANCSLEPEPDIALHGLLARLMAGTRDLEADPSAVAPVADMRAAVEDYTKLFEDPRFMAEGAEH
ncbi:DnrO protein [Lysobacter sp. GX 14042]|uniref:DnrO protein n=1 Tax=Lysobacter sp. GX 14042 TaxID=2907155 RepID=UPI001F1A1E84|nr:DnrO protein [Lysobacter sp. GX 14042]MCE7033091.1 DnrO protein [Lysobacter sp. GX 14042]